MKFLKSRKSNRPITREPKLTPVQMPGCAGLIKIYQRNLRKLFGNSRSRPELSFYIFQELASRRQQCWTTQPMTRDLWGDQERARKLFRRRSESPSRRSASTVVWVLLQTGTARASNLRPFAVRVIRRPRPSSGSAVILSRPRRRKGLRAAVKVVRSIASSKATAAIPGGFGRFRDISRENCPFVRPSGRKASSKRRASALAARCT
jgi:hypothetical protein